MKLRLLTLWLVQHAAAMIWDFGSDIRGTSIIAQASGRIASWDAVTNIPLTVPTCMDVKYVHVEVKNDYATPTVTFNRHSNTIHINFETQLSSHSKYEIKATGKRQAECKSNAGGGSDNKENGDPEGEDSKQPESPRPGDKGPPDHPDHPGGHGKKPKHPGGGGRPRDDTYNEYPDYSRPGGKQQYPEHPVGYGKKPKHPGGGGRPRDDTYNEYPDYSRPGGKQQYPEHRVGYGKKPKHPGGGGRPSDDTYNEYPDYSRPGGKQQYPEHRVGYGKKPKHPGGGGRPSDDTYNEYPNKKRPGSKTPRNPKKPVSQDPGSTFYDYNEGKLVQPIGRPKTTTQRRRRPKG